DVMAIQASSESAPARNAVSASDEAAIAARSRMTLTVTLILVSVYLGFMALIGYAGTSLGWQVLPGLSVAIVLSLIVIVIAWVLTFIYVRWVNANATNSNG